MGSIISIHKDVRRLIFEKYLNNVDRYFLMKSLYYERKLTDLIVINCIPDYDLFDWLILNANIPFIPNLDIHVAGKGCVKHLKYFGVRDSVQCAIVSTNLKNKKVREYLKQIYPSAFCNLEYFLKTHNERY